MKKIFTLLATVCIGGFSFGQVFQSNLSSWASGDPTDWMTTARTSIASSNVVEQTGFATYGTSMASLINASTSHKRFATGAITVTGGQAYEIEIWLVCQGSGEIRTNYYDATNAAYGTYNPYIDAAATSAGSLVMVSQIVTVPASCTSAEFILSLRNTDATQATLDIGILVDSVAITAVAPPTPSLKSIYEIQYTTAMSGDSPQKDSLITTHGIVTGIMQFGASRHSFFIQDSAKAWNGLYVYYTNDSSLVRGDSVEVTGTVTEYNGLTELTSVSAVTKLGTGAIPMPVSNTTLNANNEQWEGVLINVSNSECTSNSVGFGQWELNDGSGVLLADDDIFPYATSAIVNDFYDVIGIGHYSFGDYKILPRDINDISTTTGINELNTIAVTAYPNPAKNMLYFDLNGANNATINILDITGKTLKTVKASNKVNVSLNAFANGVYFYTISDSEGQTIATSKFVVAK